MSKTATSHILGDMDQTTFDISALERAVRSTTRSGSSDYDLDPAVIAHLPKGRRLRDASVLIPLVRRGSQISVVLTRRSTGLKHHPGQIAFPGGKVDATDKDAASAALREAHEEIGLPPGMVSLIGAIDTHETVTGFSVQPFVGVVSDGFRPRPELGEVEEVFEVPLPFLMRPDNFQTQSRDWQGRKRHYYVIPYGPYYIWGATARILRGLAMRVSRAG